MNTDEACRRLLDAFEVELSKKANVVGLGIVDEPDGEVRVAVYVSKKQPVDELPSEDVIPSELQQGDDSARTRVIEQGTPMLEGF